MESQILALLKGNWYFKYQLVLQIPIGTSITNWYFKYQLIYKFLCEVMSATYWYQVLRCTVSTHRIARLNFTGSHERGVVFKGQFRSVKTHEILGQQGLYN
jgi:hypothetical protein